MTGTLPVMYSPITIYVGAYFAAEPHTEFRILIFLADEQHK